MRRSAATAAWLALLVVAAAPTARAEDAKPAPWTCTRPELSPLPREPTARDLHDHGLRARLREIECELERRRSLGAGALESCYFGPEYARITNERYEEIRQAHKGDPVELWHALLREPEDPNLPPIEIRVSSKSGPNCADDRDRKLEAEADAVLKELNVR
jgi:hypothetical protein